MEKFYIQHDGKVIEINEKFKLVMAITLDPKLDNKRGIVRCVINREGDVTVKVYTDRSELHLLSGESLEDFKIGERLNLKAVGADLDTLEMTMPVLLGSYEFGAKEVSVAPLNGRGFRFNLIESKDREDGTSYSTIRVAIVKDMGEAWEYGDIVFHPKEHSISWIGRHASPGPLFPKNFIDVGEGKLLGMINGRETNQKMLDGAIKYGMFSIGLFIYDYENGKINWVSPEPFIQDSEARTITFASQFVETDKREGILYAHVDDSFVRAYSITESGVRLFLRRFGIKI